MRRRKDRKLVGPLALCPWCGFDPLDRAPWNRRARYKSGTSQTRRLLRKGRAKVVTVTYRNERSSIDRVVCAHPCHN